MTLNLSFKLKGGGYLLTSDGNMTDDTKKAIERSDYRKIFKAARNIAIAISGYLDDREIAIIKHLIKKYFGNVVIRDLRQDYSFLEECLNSAVLKTGHDATLLTVCGTSPLTVVTRKPKGRRASTTIQGRTVTATGYISDVTNVLVRRHGLQMVNLDIAKKDALWAYTKTNEIDNRIGGKIYDWMVQEQTAWPLGTIGAIDGGVLL